MFRIHPSLSPQTQRNHPSDKNHYDYTEDDTETTVSSTSSASNDKEVHRRTKWPFAHAPSQQHTTAKDRQQSPAGNKRSAVHFDLTRTQQVEAELDREDYCDSEIWYTAHDIVYFQSQMVRDATHLLVRHKKHATNCLKLLSRLDTQCRRNLSHGGSTTTTTATDIVPKLLSHNLQRVLYHDADDVASNSSSRRLSDSLRRKRRKNSWSSHSNDDEDTQGSTALPQDTDDEDEEKWTVLGLERILLSLVRRKQQQQQDQDQGRNFLSSLARNHASKHKKQQQQLAEERFALVLAHTLASSSSF